MTRSAPLDGSTAPPSSDLDAGAGAGPPQTWDAPPAWKVWTATLIMGGLAGTVSWLAGEKLVEYFRPATRVVFGSGGPMTIASPQELASTMARNATLAFGVLGGSLGMALGGAGGLLRGSTRRAAMAALVGLALGIGAGVASSLVVLPFYNRVMTLADETNAGDLVTPLLTHGAIWSAIGAACGLAFGIGVGGRSILVRAMLGGLLGGAVGAAVYELIGAIAFPLDHTAQPLSSSWESRLLARQSVALLVAAGAAAAFAEPKRRKPTQP